jgi:hypothetical protein
VGADGDGRLLGGGQQLGAGGHGLIVYQRFALSVVVANFADHAHTGV